MDKSYVSLAICPICKEETGELLLDKRLRDVFEKHTITPNVCAKCREQYLLEGIMLFNPKTGSLVVIKDSAFKKVFEGQEIPKQKICFCTEEVLNRLQGK